MMNITSEDTSCATGLCLGLFWSRVPQGTAFRACGSNWHKVRLVLPVRPVLKVWQGPPAQRATPASGHAVAWDYVRRRVTRPVYAIERDEAAFAVQFGRKKYLYWVTVSTGATEAIDLHFEGPTAQGRALGAVALSTGPLRPMCSASKDGAWHITQRLR